MKEFVRQALAAILKASPEFEIVALEGDASDRRYYRVRTEDETPDLVLMELLTLKNRFSSEEATLYHDTGGELPFINIQRFLAGLKLPVPQIHRYDETAGLMLLEDLGQKLLFDAVRQDGIEDSLALYRQALDLLVRLQSQAGGDSLAEEDCLAFRQRFGPALLEWEFDHFLEYGLEKKGRALLPDDKKEIRKIFSAIAGQIAKAPVVFCHRDYHSRNLIVGSRDRLGLIDFQDALLGPATYDLASLLLDSYVAVPPPLIDELFDYYLQKAQAARIPGTDDEKEFRLLLDLTAIQRNLKAAGRFEYISQVKHNPKFLAFIPQTMGYVRRNLMRHPELERLRILLARYCPELE